MVVAFAMDAEAPRGHLVKTSGSWDRNRRPFSGCSTHSIRAMSDARSPATAIWRRFRCRLSPSPRRPTRRYMPRTQRTQLRQPLRPATATAAAAVELQPWVLQDSAPLSPSPSPQLPSLHASTLQDIRRSREADSFLHPQRGSLKDGSRRSFWSSPVACCQIPVPPTSVLKHRPSAPAHRLRAYCATGRGYNRPEL